ncbi:indole-3-glycerol phosphate synthase TrpC [Bacillaceae bacterium W0354]
MTETILDRILEKKKIEVEKMKLEPEFGEKIKVNRTQSLYDTLLRSNRLAVIAEIKRASPSKGDINVGIDLDEQATIYEQGGASAISVLTDTPFFKGTIEDLVNVRKKVSLPILCKDFIIDEIQIDRAKRAGANVILLIAAALPFERLKELNHYAKSSGLEVLFEVHNEEELETAFKIGATIIGINNRNLKTFEVDLAVTENLIKRITNPKITVISESGIHSHEDALRVAKAGAHGILVGESLMLSDDVEAKLQSLQVPIV